MGGTFGLGPGLDNTLKILRLILVLGAALLLVLGLTLVLVHRVALLPLHGLALTPVLGGAFGHPDRLALLGFALHILCVPDCLLLRPALRVVISAGRNNKFQAGVRNWFKLVETIPISTNFTTFLGMFTMFSFTIAKPCLVD